MMLNCLICLLALILDTLMGELPNAVHPVVWMGSFIHWGASIRKQKRWKLLQGVFLIIAGILLFGGISAILAFLLTKTNPWIAGIVTMLLLKPVFSLKALLSAGTEIQKALVRGNLPRARYLTGYHLVSRDTTMLTESEVVSATVESIAENFCDSVIAPLFFFMIGGLPAAYAYRFVNTADAMIGYRTEKWEQFGKFAARFDDVLNWVPARIAGLFITFAALIARHGGRAAWNCMIHEHKKTASPNAGWTMAAMAGALSIRLEKKAHYILNSAGDTPTAEDTLLAIRIIANATLLFCVIILIVAYAASSV